VAFLLPADETDALRYMGFPMYGDQLSSGFGYRYGQKYLLVLYRLRNLSDSEYTVVTTVYLPNLRILEQDIYQVRENSDTSRAAVWYRNSLELAERVQNYNWWRGQMINFFGVVPLNSPSATFRINV
jgi:hypothetical protein